MNDPLREDLEPETSREEMKSVVYTAITFLVGLLALFGGLTVLVFSLG